MTQRRHCIREAFFVVVVVDRAPPLAWVVSVHHRFIIVGLMRVTARCRINLRWRNGFALTAGERRPII